MIGVGGAGGNAVEHMIDEGVQGVEFIAANTDAQALAASARAQRRSSSARPAWAPAPSRKSAAQRPRNAVDRIREAIDGAHMLFITAGMGGGTGTGAAPVIARVAKEHGHPDGRAWSPSRSTFEGPKRMKSADAGLDELEANVDSLIVILNDKLRRRARRRRRRRTRRSRTPTTC